MAQIDLDHDGQNECRFDVDGLSKTVAIFFLDYSQSSQWLVLLAAENSRVGYRLGELIGLKNQQVPLPVPQFTRQLIQAQRYLDDCEPFGCFNYADPDPQREFATNTVAIIGVRMTQPDGYHYGWIEFSRPCNKPWVVYALAGYALHPLPETPIPAGVVPQPELVLDRQADALTLSWRPEWQGYRLEWVQLLNPDVDWKPVPGVVGSRVTLPSTAAAGYFRLAKDP